MFVSYYYLQLMYSPISCSASIGRAVHGPLPTWSHVPGALHIPHGEGGGGGGNRRGHCQGSEPDSGKFNSHILHYLTTILIGPFP